MFGSWQLLWASSYRTSSLSPLGHLPGRPQVWSVTAVLCTPSSSAPVLLFPGQVPTERCPLSEPLLRPDPVPLSRSREGTGRPLASTAVSSQDLASPGIKGVVQAGLRPPSSNFPGWAGSEFVSPLCAAGRLGPVRIPSDRSHPVLSQN